MRPPLVQDRTGQDAMTSDYGYGMDDGGRTESRWGSATTSLMLACPKEELL